MDSEFSTLGRSARELIPVPALPIESIRRRSHAARARNRAAVFAASAAIALGAAGAGTGVGAKIYHGVQVWLSGGESTFAAHSGIIMRYPLASELRTDVAGATFPVVFPAGLPAGSRVDMVTSAPLGHPSVITVSYQNGAGFNTAIGLVDPAVVDTGRASLPTGTDLPPLRATYHFRVGGEIVVAMTKNISPADWERLKASMTKISPEDSLALTESMLPKMTVLGATVRLERAERYRPSTGHSVLLDEAYLSTIPALAKDAKPLLDRRIIRLSNLTYAKGDIVKAAGIPSRDVAISAGGVRAIEAALRTAGEVRNHCACEILFNQPNDGTYLLWDIPLSPSAAVRHYSVDAKTFAVTPAPA